MKDKELYQEFDYELTGELIKINSPGILLTNNHDFSNQIFDLGGMNIYILLSVEFSKLNGKDCYVCANFLLGSEIYNWKGVKPSNISKKDYLNSKFKKVYSSCV